MRPRISYSRFMAQAGLARVSAIRRLQVARERVRPQQDRNYPDCLCDDENGRKNSRYPWRPREPRLDLLVKYRELRLPLDKSFDGTDKLRGPPQDDGTILADRDIVGHPL